jgi:polyhydroxybutyrate depolymerase
MEVNQMMKRQGILAGVALALGTTGCATKLEVFTHDNVARHYTLYKPEGLSENAPLVFVLHGYSGFAQLYQGAMGFDAVADEHGFAIVYPQGTYDDSFITHWNAGLDISDVDDIGFLTALAQQLQADHGFDPERTFTSGISNGGFMSYTLACQSSNVFKGMASIIGTMSGHTWNNCTPETPIPVLQISGLLDSVVPMDGTMSADGGWGGAPEIDTVVNYWVELNACTESETQETAENIEGIHHTACDNQNEVWHYKISDMGHEIPSDKNYNLETTEKIWAFFSRQ